MRLAYCAVRSDLTPVLGWALWLAMAALPAVAGAQTTGASGGGGRGSLLASRAALESRVVELDSVGGAAVAAELTALRRRLADGDFKVGDRVFLVVEGEEALSDTFTVGSGRELVLPVVGTVPLHGVLRSELEPVLRREIGRFLLSPAVRATALIIVSVTGDVATPGFYAVPVTALVADVVMAAGGGTRDAKVKDLRVERGGETIWNSAAVAQAVREGRTLDELGLRSGDLFVMPGRNRTGAESGLRVVSLLLSIPLTAYALTRIF